MGWITINGELVHTSAIQCGDLNPAAPDTYGLITGTASTLPPCDHRWHTRTDTLLLSSPAQMERRCSKCGAISYTVVGVAAPPQPKFAPSGTWDPPWPSETE